MTDTATVEPGTIEYWCPATSQPEQFHEGRCNSCGSTEHQTMDSLTENRPQVIKLDTNERMVIASALGFAAGTRGDSRMRLSDSLIVVLSTAAKEDRTPLVHMFNSAYEQARLVS